MHTFGGILTGALVVFLIYRRARRHIGPQAVNEFHLLLRLGSLCLSGGIVLLVAWATSATSLSGGLLGLGSGVVLSVFGLALTRWEGRGDNRRYTPNGWVGMAVIAIFLGRFAYKLLTAKPNTSLAAAAYGPLTVAVVMLVFGYNFGYYAGVLWKAREFI